MAGDFNYDLFKVLQNKFLDIFTDHVQMINKPTHISGSLIDHVYIKKALMEEFFTNVSVENIYFSDHDAVRIAIHKNLLISILIHQICYNQVINCFSKFLSDLWTNIDARLADIFSIIDLPFAGLLVVTIGDLLQLPPVKGQFAALTSV